MSRLYKMLALVMAAIIIYELASAVYVSKTTGLLVISLPDKDTLISIDQNGHRIENISTGGQRVRLAPGSYDIIASKDKSQVIKTVSIEKSRSYTISLNPQQNQNPKAAYNSEANDLIAKYLPFTERHSAYRISYFYQIKADINQPVIFITAPTEDGHQAALKWISSLGYNTGHLEIKFEKSAL